jgi:hypothetical protein
VALAFQLNLYELPLLVGVIIGGKTPEYVINLAPGQSQVNVIEAIAPRAGLDRLVNLRFYDACNRISATNEFPATTAIARKEIGDVAARYMVTLDIIEVGEARSRSSDTLVGAMHGNAGEQRFEDKRFYGDHGDGAMFLGRMQIGTFDIVPDDMP